VILKCEKLHAMKLAERKEVVEKSGLCTFCLRHGADVECYAKGGLSKPKCERLGCNGEHVTGLHALLGEADAAVNLVGGEEGGLADTHEGGDICQDEWAGENPWDGILEVPEEMGESEGWMYSHGDQGAVPDADVTEAGEWEYESLWVGTVSAVDTPEGASDVTSATTYQEPGQNRAEEEATEDGDVQWGQKASPAGGATDTPEEPGHGPAHHPNGDRSQEPRPRRRTPGRPGHKAGPGQTVDQRWEEARHDAWLRQLLSDDSIDGSDEEERYGRFAESGRWMSERYGIPQYQTTTLGRECSA
jgi:hypothetical protein